MDTRDPLAAALTLAAMMFAAWTLARWGSRRRAAREPGPGREGASDKYSDLMLALLGLLLAFTFSISLDQHANRRSAVAEGANAISDFHTCADLQSEPWRTRIKHNVRAYVETQLELAQPLGDEARLQEILGRIDVLHDKMQLQVREVVTAGSPSTEPLVDTFNAMTSAMTLRLSARRARLPGPVVLVLVVVSVVSMVLLGWRSERADGAAAAGAAGFAAIVGLVVWVTLDLNRPYAGAIQVSQEPMERLLANLRK